MHIINSTFQNYKRQRSGPVSSIARSLLPRTGSRFMKYILTEYFSRIVLLFSVAAVTYFCLPYPGVERVLCFTGLIAAVAYIATTNRHLEKYQVQVQKMEARIGLTDQAICDVEDLFVGMDNQEPDELDQHTIDEVNKILNTPTAAMLRRAGLLPQAHEYQQKGIVVETDDNDSGSSVQRSIGPLRHVDITADDEPIGKQTRRRAIGLVSVT